MKAIQQQWLGSAVGRRMDPDKAYNLQCVDVVDDYAQTIFGVPWPQCVGGVDFAKNLPYVVPGEYWTWHTQGLPQIADVLIWGGGPANRMGHTAVGAGAPDANGMNVIQQNSNGLANLAANLQRMNWYQNGTGQLTGWLRPRPEKIIGGEALADGVKILTVTGNPAMVRTSPQVANNLAPAYPQGIARGAKLAVVGYVAGQDPYPNDGVQDDAWVKTVSGYYVWANAAGNDLTGLKKVG